nr:MAG TPA: hypothetical protein [Caudoviricetes sp.]
MSRKFFFAFTKFLLAKVRKRLRNAKICDIISKELFHQQELIVFIVLRRP